MATERAVNRKLARAITVYSRMFHAHREMLTFDTKTKNKAKKHNVNWIRRLREMDGKVTGIDESDADKITEIMVGIAVGLCEIMKYNVPWVEKWTGWGEGAIDNLRNKFPGRWEKAIHLACDTCFDTVHMQRVRIAARMLAVSEEASKVIEYAVLAKEYTAPGEEVGKKVSKDQRLAAEQVLKYVSQLDEDIRSEALLLAEDDEKLDEKEEVFEKAAETMKLDKMLSKVNAARRTA